jgi:hypothetical protein
MHEYIVEERDAFPTEETEQRYDEEEFLPIYNQIKKLIIDNRKKINNFRRNEKETLLIE